MGCIEEIYPVWEKMTLYRRFESIAAQSPLKPFFIDGAAYNYGEVLDAVGQTVSSLETLGVKEGDCVITAFGNRIEFIYITFALAALGAIKVPVNKKAGIPEVQYILNQTEAKVLFVEKSAAAEYKHICPHSVNIICLDDECGEEYGCVSWQAFFNNGCGRNVIRIRDNADGISDIIYTSGSTGRPKGVMLTHDMLLRSAYASCINRGFETGRRIYVPLPLFHVYGYVEGLLAAMLVQGSILVTREKFDAARSLEAMEKWAVNDILSVPFIMMKLLRYPQLGTYDLGALNCVYCSASLCPKWVWKEIRSKLNVSEITTGYGMTEVSGASTQTSPPDDDSIIASSAGRILYGGCAGCPEFEGNVIEYKVIDGATGAEMPPGIYGELICRGPIVTKGYFKDPEADSRAFDGDGWFHTGDVGYFDGGGYLKLLGRCNDIYKINGENVSPQFLDKVISKCPHVLMVETVGVPDEQMGFVGAAFIEADSRETWVEEKIKAYCRATLAPYQVPRYFFFGNSRDWPRTSSDKVQKYKLIEIAINRMEEQNGQS